MSLYDRIVREACRRLSPVTERQGFVLSPVHFYYPIPAVRDLVERDVWSSKSSLPGLAWDLGQQLEFVAKLEPYGSECSWDEHRDETSATYGWNASTFGFTSAMFAHAIVRLMKPKRIVEVGCGWSTTILLAAAAKNEQEGSAAVDYIGVEPYPPQYLAKVPGSEAMIASRVQDVELDIFENLDAGDILFIDSSHGLSIGSDVQWLFLEVLPRLKPGVVVHVHDIHLPYEYPRHHAEQQRWFWNEQYLLQGFLAQNDYWRILVGGYALCLDHPSELRKIFSYYDPTLHGETGSFWMQRKHDAGEPTENSHVLS